MFRRCVMGVEVEYQETSRRVCVDYQETTNELYGGLRSLVRVVWRRFGK